jgi:diaminopimelate decarboxylase
MSETVVRSGCEGVVALPARLEPWQAALCEQPDALAGLLERHGSPLNVIAPAPLARNAAELQHAADSAGVDMRIFFARKANKALSLVDEARRHGLGIDVASERELRQVLERGVTAADIVVTAAVKPLALLELCVAAGVTVAIDNEDELELLAALAARATRSAPIALRLAPVVGGGRPATRFGLAPRELLALAGRHCPATTASRLTIAGIHFHLDGYAAADRVTALTESIALAEALRERGHQPAFIDIGGGIPMSYLDDEAPWLQFWNEHRDALLGRREPLTFEGHGLGLTAHAGEILGRPNAYPSFQAATRGEWLAQVLAAEVGTRAGTQTVAEALRARGLQLRCEPGRSLADGCGLTAARVEFRKQRRDGTWLIGLAMNRTQCRSTADDFLVDPLLVRPAASAPAARATGPVEAFLVGAYCIERELLTWRRLRFPHGVAVGDIVVFPNTAGYLMHILESASHQMPLARNLVSSEQGELSVDPIDEPPSGTWTDAGPSAERRPSLRQSSVTPDPGSPPTVEHPNA